MIREFNCVNNYYKTKSHKFIKHLIVLFLNLTSDSVILCLICCDNNCDVVDVFGLSEAVLPNLTQSCSDLSMLYPELFNIIYESKCENVCVIVAGKVRLGSQVVEFFIIGRSTWWCSQQLAVLLTGRATVARSLPEPRPAVVCQQLATLAAVSRVLFGDRDVVSVCVHASLPAALPHIDGKERQEDSMEGFANRG